MPTRRESIAELLERTSYPMTVHDICQSLDIRQRSAVYEDLEHIARSLKIQEKELLVEPARCANCSYVFKVGTSVKKPSKCPRCRSEWIMAQGFLIRPKKS
jgi:predicted Zn-ribbon and HTH transcriptional regulator